MSSVLTHQPLHRTPAEAPQAAGQTRRLAQRGDDKAFSSLPKRIPEPCAGPLPLPGVPKCPSSEGGSPSGGVWAARTEGGVQADGGAG